MSSSRKGTKDGDLFAAVMRDVKPLRRSRPSPPPAPSPPRDAAASAPRSELKPLPPVSRKPGAANPGIDRRTAERLRKGEMAIDRRLDLHGMTEEAAHAALDRFVRHAWHEGVRVLLVITGKGSVREGGGVLRRNLPRWLAAGETAPHVLRVESAQPRHGGPGAYYVLLRRRRSAGG